MVWTPLKRIATADPDQTGRAMAIALTALYGLFIALVTLAPAEWNPSARHLALQWARFWQEPAGDASWASPHEFRDLATNFLLYLPLGLLAAWILPRRRCYMGRTAVFALGPALSLALETAQAFTDRYPWLWDVIMNGAGHLVGCAVMGYVLARYRLGPALLVGARHEDSRASLAGALRLLYVAGVAVLALLPYDVTVSAGLIWAQLRGDAFVEGAVRLNLIAPWEPQRLAGLLRAFLLMFPFGFLGMLALTPGTSPNRRLWRITLEAVALGAAVEAAQVCILSRTTDLAQVPAAALGGCFGAVAGRAWLAPHARPQAPTDCPEWLLIGALLYLPVLMTQAWWPFRFLRSWTDAAVKLAFQSYWIPFHSYAWRRSLADWRDLGAEIGWYVPLGFMLGAWARAALARWPRRARVPLVLGAIFLVGAVFELGQCMIEGRTVDLTDALSHLAGGAIGYGLSLALPGFRAGAGLDDRLHR